MTWTTGMGLAYGFCEAAAVAAPPELQWIFLSGAKAFVAVGFILAADQRSTFLPPQDPPRS